MKNNIISDNITRAVRIESGVNIGNLIFDHNDYDFGTGEEFLLVDTAYTLAGWRSASGLDMHSFIANPDFVSPTPSAPGDFVIQSGSPDVGTGLALGPTSAVGLDPTSSWPSNVTTINQTVAWDIGAFVVP